MRFIVCLTESAYMIHDVIVGESSTMIFENLWFYQHWRISKPKILDISHIKLMSLNFEIVMHQDIKTYHPPSLHWSNQIHSVFLSDNNHLKSTTSYYLSSTTHLVSMTKLLIGALRGSCVYAHDRFTVRDVKLSTSGRPGGSGTSAKTGINYCRTQVPNELLARFTHLVPANLQPHLGCVDRSQGSCIRRYRRQKPD